MQPAHPVKRFCRTATKLGFHPRKAPKIPMLSTLIRPDGSTTLLGHRELRQWSPDDGLLWVHMQRDQPDTRRWLQGESGLDAVSADALLAEYTRPRVFRAAGEGLVITLRGLNPQEDPAHMADLASLRLWVSPGRIVSLYRYPITAVDEVRAEFVSEQAPADMPELLTRLCACVTRHLAPLVLQLEEQMDAIEEQLELEQGMPSDGLSVVRKQCSRLRRHLGPQREMFRELGRIAPEWIAGQEDAWREIRNSLEHQIESLAELQERGGIIQESLNYQTSEVVNRRMYWLTVVAGFFVPLTFITGLLGTNVGGIPGAGSGSGFLAVCGFLAGSALLQFSVFKWLKWI